MRFCRVLNAIFLFLDVNRSTVYGVMRVVDAQLVDPRAVVAVSIYDN